MDIKLNIISRFFIFCAGVTFDLIKKCPRFEINKYISIGVTVFITALLASFSSYFAFNLIFDNNIICIVLSIVWGGVIFNLDRYIISSMRSNNQKTLEFIKAIPRIVIAILIAVVISKPLEIKLFEKEIYGHHEKRSVESIYKVRNKYNEDVVILDDKIKIKESYFEKRLLLRDKYYEEYKCECTGTCGTKIKGYGKECLSRKKRYEAFLVELEADRKYKDSSITKLISAKEEIESQIQNEILLIKDKAEILGFFEQIKILNDIDKVSSFFILFIFIMIETAPIFTKLLSQKGPYDNLIMEYEIQFETDYLKKVDNYEHERTKNKKLKEMSAKLEIKSKESEIKNILKQDAYERYEKMKNDLDALKTKP